MLSAPRTSIGSTFVLPGPRTYTFQSLIDLVSAMTLKSHAAPILPKPVALAIATVLNRALWWPTISPDEVKRKYIDDAFSHAVADMSSAPAGWAPVKQHVDATVGVSGEPTKTWEDLNIEPEVIENIAISILRRYRSAATYDVPVEHGGFKPRKAYHVVE
jgi:NADH dehydrogenase (ubiquinone) 1 alpha subcomplex subunit 9